MTNAQSTIRETRDLVAEYGGPGIRLPDQVRAALDDRDARIERLRGALIEACKALDSIAETTSQYPNWHDDELAKLAARLRAAELADYVR